MILESRRPLIEQHDLALVDLDGVVYRGPQAVPGAAAALRAARDSGQQVLFVTNNASREPEDVAAHLTAIGVDAQPTDVVTAAQAAAALLRERLPAGEKVLVVGGAGLVTAVRAAGLEVVGSADDRPTAVVQGFDPAVGWPELAEATYAVRAGAWYVASNLDITLPNERGLAPGNGALVGVVQAATGVSPVSAGKPEPAMFRLATQRVGAHRPFVVGDRLDTDLAGARAAGFPGLHVLTGVSSGRDAVLAAPGERPSYLGTDLSSLLLPHPAPVRDGDWWVCGSARGQVADGALRLVDHGPSREGDDGLDPLRVACAAVWAAVDDGRPVDAASIPSFPPQSPAGPLSETGTPGPAVHSPRTPGPAR